MVLCTATLCWLTGIGDSVLTRHEISSSLCAEVSTRCQASEVSG